ncbi:MAG: hypothetical protein HN921_06100 [Bacteroidetes bacterium]|nr:hypothetical protein [Bacteroidota bacterium]MBT7996563.1 hypothetical protein [Bacteroidota bacterium]
MKKLIIIIFSITLFVSCDKFNFSAKGTLKGTIGIYEGNCMPAPNKPPCEPKPIATTVVITHPSEHYQKKLVVAKTQSNEDGSYEVMLAEGKYSLFLLDGDEYVCDHWQCSDQCYCSLFEIKKDAVSILDANIDHASW